MPENQNPQYGNYSLETQGAILYRIERDMATKEQIRSMQELTNNRMTSIESRITSLETKVSTENSKIHGRIDGVAKDDMDLKKIQASSRLSLIGAVSVATISLIGTIVTVIIRGG